MTARFLNFAHCRWQQPERANSGNQHLVHQICDYNCTRTSWFVVVMENDCVDQSWTFFLQLNVKFVGANSLLLTHCFTGLWSQMCSSVSSFLYKDDKCPVDSSEIVTYRQYLNCKQSRQSSCGHLFLVKMLGQNNMYSYIGEI